MFLIVILKYLFIHTRQYNSLILVYTIIVNNFMPIKSQTTVQSIAKPKYKGEKNCIKEKIIFLYSTQTINYFTFEIKDSMRIATTPLGSPKMADMMTLRTIFEIFQNILAVSPNKEPLRLRTRAVLVLLLGNAK